MALAPPAGAKGAISLNIAKKEFKCVVDWLNDIDHPFIKQMGLLCVMHQLGSEDDSGEQLELTYSVVINDKGTYK